MRIQMPQGAKMIIDRLESRGYRADIVGGCVRDALLGRTANDFDVTTSAPPHTVSEIFSDLRVIETGIAHGTVTILVHGEPYEVTTYRIDGEYTDSRHPDSVSFAARIEDDLSRRDFTVNAMAYSDVHGITDLFGGMEDLKHGVIRAVGDPEKRFTEDALRILRAIRFSSVLGFRIEESTASALRKLAPRLSAVSSERIYVEWMKLLGGASAYRIISEYNDLITVFLPELCGVTIPSEDAFVRADALARFVALFYSALGEDASDAFIAATLRLKTDKKTREIGSASLKSIKTPLDSRTDAVRLLLKIGEDAARLTLDVRAALGIPTFSDSNVIESIKNDGTVYKISDLAVGGNDLLTLGIPPREIGNLLHRLLLGVISGELINERETLLGALLTINQGDK